MKTLEINEKSQKIKEVVLTKLIISQLLSHLEYQAWYQITATTHFPTNFPISKYSIFIFMNINENMRN